MLREQGQSGQIFFFDLQQSEIGFFVDSDEACFEDVTLAYRNRTAGITGQRQGYTDALRAFDHVRIGHDVAIGIDDHAGADGVLAHDESGLGAIFLVQRAVAGHENLNHRR